MTRRSPQFRTRRLFRDPRRGWVAGVCAGIASYLGVPVFWVRLLIVLPLLSPLCPLVIISYIVAALRIPREPDELYESVEQQEFWQSVNTAPAATFGQLRHTMRDLEHRLRRLEAYVTSTEFEFHQNLRSS